MKNALKIVSLLLCALFLFSSCGVPSLPGEETTTSPLGENGVSGVNGDGEKQLPFNPADGLNPFFARSNENKYVFSFLYKSLFDIDKNYNPIPVVAESIVVSGNTATVKIRSGMTCRGSSDITAADVVYSFNLAKNSYLYSGELAAVESAAAAGSAVNFILRQPDIFAAGKLVFPIVKEGTADIATDVPVGCGDYYYLENKLISVADAGKRITLCSINTRDSARDALKVGSSDVFFSDLSDCNYTAVTGAVSTVQLNNMVFIGMNSGNGALNKYVRSAVAAQLNSDEIILSSYEGHAVSMKLPVNPDAYCASELTAPAPGGDTALSESILDRSSFTKITNGVRTNGAYSLKFSLIVNNDNRYRVSAAYAAADSLNKAGFSVTVEALPYAQYAERIASGNFDMYLGEVKLDGSMDISQFFSDESPLGKGVDKTERAATEYARYRSGEISAAEYYKIFAEFYPFVPVCFRTGYIISSQDVTLDLSRAPDNIYYNMA